MNRRLVTLLALLTLVALVVAACSVARPSSGVSTSPDIPTAPATEAPASVDPSADPATEPPTNAPTAAPTEEPPAPTETPTEPATEAPSAAADVCTGSQDNRDFFASVARDMDWTVLCAVLPKGWVVQTGSYRQANGGRMEISYKHRGGATLSLAEGAFCADTDGCVPPGSDVGDADLGPMAGTLVALDDGGWAIVVDRGAQRSWLLVTHGVDEATARGFGAALAVVEG
ncbi:MAG: hypothetical protein AB1627_08020 [Chloroflexota bacterium]